MNWDHFEDLIEQRIDKVARGASQGQASDHFFYLTPLQASRIEEKLNQKAATSDHYLGFVVEAVREQHQKLYHSEAELSRTFEQQEDANREHYRESLNMAIRLSKGLQDCFLALSLLQREAVALYFRHPPDYHHLRLPNQPVFRPMGMIGIANKILRGDYPSAREFQFDMNVLIGTCKTLYAQDEAMFNNTVLFEYKFWQIYECQVPKYKGSRKEFNRMSREIARLGERRAPRRKQYSIEEKRRILRAFNNQDSSFKQRVREYLSKNCRQVIDGGELRVTEIPTKHMRWIEKELQPNMERVDPRRQDMYYSDEQSQMKPEEMKEMRIGEQDFDLEYDD